MRPAAATLSQTVGDWRLDRLPKSQTVFLALALSAGVHAVFLLAFNQPAVRLIPGAKPVEPPTVEWRLNEDTEPPPPSTEITDLKEPPAVNIPRLLDTPGPVDVLPDFVQPLQPPAPTLEINKDNIVRIPTNTVAQKHSLERVFDIKSLDRTPTVVAQPAPHFPSELQNEVASAELVVEFIVDTSGSVRGATIVSSTHPGFDRAALDGVRQWKFRPGVKDGHKVNTRIRQPIRFTLQETPGN